ncbi:hypothetical protein HCU64_14570 [Methylobacterium sp. C25]|uniref:hypothetical protein n=1 Tax=Methylobacterium sp. C25 TaxID=2721622 RepID=UPI001F44C6F4|nr:hypothetical protein [Methylobacterium sp. C25]MCE4224983.1 hypothetical protein [Methylobacterium sp. C25]
MTRMLAILTLAGSAAFASVGAAQARPVPMPESHYTTFDALEAPAREPIIVSPDTDGANAKNPALPSYQRGRGQETGGPARQLIGN